MRRFSLAYIEVPRKNGKSQLAAGIGLYMFACDGGVRRGGLLRRHDGKAGARSLPPGAQMMARSPELAQALGVLVRSKRHQPPGRRQPLRGGGQARRRRVPHCGIVDEYHEHDSDALFDTFRTGMGARQQPLLFVITTAGDNTAGPCKLLQGDICNILESKARAR
jgi:phage terminase large subunit-like protein